jgi:flagellar biosynthetic protein FliQ
MDSLAVIDVSKEAIMVLLKVSLPLLLVALIVGLAISLFQALTQIQEPTLSFVPKIIAMFLMLLLMLNFIGSTIGGFADDVMSRIVGTKNTQ